MRAPIVSTKHYVQKSIFQVPTTTVTSDIHVSATDLINVDVPEDVQEGSIVKAIFIEYWILGTFNEGSFVVMVEKVPTASANPTFTNMTTLHGYANKKNILFVSQGLVAEDNANPIPVLRQWIKIPKSKQRFGFRDQLKVNLISLGSDDLQACGFSTYKDYH